MIGSVGSALAGGCGDDGTNPAASTTLPPHGTGNATEGSSDTCCTNTSADTEPGATTASHDSTADDSGPTATATDSTGAPPSGCGDPPVWCPAPQTSWHWQLTNAVDTSVDVAMYDIDLFDVDTSTIGDLQRSGRVVICYFSAGSHEDWRPDADAFPDSAIGSPLDEWPGERWLDVRDPDVRDALAQRLDLAVDKGCDGVEPDNVDGYTNGSGFPLTAADQLDFNQWLAEQSHARGLSVGLKNDLDQVEALLPYFDWALNEECMSYDECDRLAPFIDAGKAVFHVEYVDDPADGPARAATVCPDALDRSFSTLIKGWDLDAWQIVCE